MESKGIDAATLAKETGIKANVISDWKTKGTNPRAEKIGRICEFLNISCDYLLTGKETQLILSRNEQELLKILHSIDDEYEQIKFIGKVEEVAKMIINGDNYVNIEKSSNEDTKVS